MKKSGTDLDLIQTSTGNVKHMNTCIKTTALDIITDKRQEQPIIGKCQKRANIADVEKIHTRQWLVYFDTM